MDLGAHRYFMNKEVKDRITDDVNVKDRESTMFNHKPSSFFPPPPWLFSPFTKVPVVHDLYIHVHRYMYIYIPSKEGTSLSVLISARCYKVKRARRDRTYFVMTDVTASLVMNKSKRGWRASQTNVVSPTHSFSSGDRSVSTADIEDNKMTQSTTPPASPLFSSVKRAQDRSDQTD